METFLTGCELFGGLRRERGFGFYDVKNAKFSRVYKRIKAEEVRKKEARAAGLAAPADAPSEKKLANSWWSREAAFDKDDFDEFVNCFNHYMKPGVDWAWLLTGRTNPHAVAQQMRTVIAKKGWRMGNGG